MKTLPVAIVDLPAYFPGLSDRELLAEVERLAGDERAATARLVASLAELDRRRLYLEIGCSSLFTYCTQVLHLSEHAAYRRIEAARASLRFPLVLERLAEGALTLTALHLLATHLTVANHRELLDAVRHKSKGDVEHLVARIDPKPEAPASIRKLPAPRHLARLAAPNSAALACDRAMPGVQPPPRQPGALVLDEKQDHEGQRASEPSRPQEEVSASADARPAASPGARAIVVAIAPERYKLQVTIGADTREKLRRAQDLMRHAVPDGDPAVILDRALTVLLEDLERQRFAATGRPRAARAPSPNSRHIPSAVKRAVWARDGGRCTFVGKQGRCTERGLLEFHHRVPYAAGGRATVENIVLACAAHNQREADCYFGSRSQAEIEPFTLSTWRTDDSTRSGTSCGSPQVGT